MKLWGTELFAIALELGVFNKDDRLLAGVESSDLIDIPKVSDSAKRLRTLIFDVFMREFDSDLYAMARMIGFREEVASLMRYFTEHLKAEAFSRIDVFFDHEGWKFLELNAGSLTGGMQYASLPRLAGFEQSGDVLKEWAAGMRHHGIACKSLTLFLVDELIVEEIRQPLSVFSQALQEETGSEVVISSPRSVSWDGFRLRYKGKVVDNIYCRFEQDQLLSRKDDYRDFLSALEAKAVHCPFGLGYNVFAGKGVWALLWQLCAEGKLTAEDRALVEQHLPYTSWLLDNTLDVALKEKNRLVLKPTDGYAGRDVVCGKEMTERQWEAALHAALGSGEKAYILQAYVEPIPQWVATYDVNGRLEEYQARVVWGLYFLDDKYLGGLLRALPVTHSAVINYAGGAATGPMMKAV
ncbi:hypothetical protein [Pseudomonas mosselii]|uniref:hypothetical protein n=1 Tax=Pseudomonas mosselii TaxID=78327 RepID=UPI0007701D55|nr:hypothetical protein [Pseudomonas mosselii]AMK30218.1 OrfE protein [Pseudomonas putida]MEA3234664.1 hypothetical protein [Pseudomonas mosselii]UWS65793.1 hypothetical protein N0U38_18675 [Pseudomonas mosselii]